MYLPAFPQLAETFEASASAVQLTLTSVPSSAWGWPALRRPDERRARAAPPLWSALRLRRARRFFLRLRPVDRDARRPPLRAGLRRAAPASSCHAPSCATSTPAPPTARFFSQLMMVNGAAPILAPSIGSPVLHVRPGAGSSSCSPPSASSSARHSPRRLPETLPPGGARAAARPGAAGLRRRSSATRSFVGYAGARACSWRAVFAYIAGSSFVAPGRLRAVAAAFALTFGVNGIGIVVVRPGSTGPSCAATSRGAACSPGLTALVGALGLLDGDHDRARRSRSCSRRSASPSRRRLRDAERHRARARRPRRGGGQRLGTARRRPVPRRRRRRAARRHRRRRHAPCRWPS